MAAPKIKPSSLAKLYQDSSASSNLHDKQVVESLRNRLNDKLQRDPKLVKKAALILEQWLNQKPKK